MKTVHIKLSYDQSIDTFSAGLYQCVDYPMLVYQKLRNLLFPDFFDRNCANSCIPYTNDDNSHADSYR